MEKNTFLNAYAVQEMNGYKFLTTFWSDFLVALPYGCSAVIDTYQKACEYAKINYKHFTELVLVLNWLCWDEYRKKHINNSRLFQKLYFSARDLFFKKFEKEEEALRYFYTTTD